MKNKFLKTFILFSLLAAGASAQHSHKLLPAEQEIPLNYGADRLGKRYDADMQKFRDNRLGAFIHWGLYAIYGAQNETYIDGWEKKTSNLLIYKRLCKI